MEYAVNFLGVNHGAFFRQPVNLCFHPSNNIIFSILVVVAGHTNCGGAAAALDAAQSGGNQVSPTTSLQKYGQP